MLGALARIDVCFPVEVQRLSWREKRERARKGGTECEKERMIKRGRKNERKTEREGGIEKERGEGSVVELSP